MFASPVVFTSHSSLVTALFNFSVVKFIGVKKMNALMAGKAAAASHGRQMHHGCQSRMIRAGFGFLWRHPPCTRPWLVYCSVDLRINSKIKKGDDNDGWKGENGGDGVL